MEEETIKIKDFKMEVFEMENPEGAKELKKKVEKKMEKTIEEINTIIETEVEKFFEEKKSKELKLSYIG